MKKKQQNINKLYFNFTKKWSVKPTKSYLEEKQITWSSRTMSVNLSPRRENYQLKSFPMESQIKPIRRVPLKSAPHGTITMPEAWMIHRIHATSKNLTRRQLSREWLQPKITTNLERQMTREFHLVWVHWSSPVEISLFQRGPSRMEELIGHKLQSTESLLTTTVKWLEPPFREDIIK